jgi:hypothetical protein
MSDNTRKTKYSQIGWVQTDKILSAKKLLDVTESLPSANYII